MERSKNDSDGRAHFSSQNRCQNHRVKKLEILGDESNR